MLNRTADRNPMRRSRVAGLAGLEEESLIRKLALCTRASFEVFGL
jgi:hypothetical protein